MPQLNKMADGPDFISLSEAARITGYSAGHLRYLVTNGLLRGWKFGRNYVTTPESLDTYLATNPKPGRKKDSTS